MNIALIIAGGKGERSKQDIPKQFLNIDEKPVIIYTLDAFQQHPSINSILVVCLDGWHDILWAYARQYGINKLQWVVSGGETGHDSIHNGITELKKHCAENDVILVHDANRPLVSAEIISDGLSVYSRYGSAISAIPCTEVVLKTLNGLTPEEEIPRSWLRRIQTPQIFSLGKLLWAHDEAVKRNIINPLASCSLMQTLGEPLHFSLGSEKNIRITTVDDFDIVRALLKLSLRMDLKK
ncbi:MAG: 2-C-methyl-D-erythritol 4-phosphate cytidylyltransferase [Treponema sp.]|jgi:2-C-methyl-D-erythritol 4-phosphate cytidylyltransferase|nr:2-C-methyl-D-erythritol 4-phosphate cytidylyltransferase [Treponema sp.]